MNITNAEDVVRVLRAKRKECKITQKKLAETLGVSNTYISDIETGRVNPSLKTLVKIITVLGLQLKLS